MAQVFGGRWQVSSGKPLARSNQSEILRVVDVRGEYEGEYALKRILHPLRQERFKREIGAVTALRHPNVIGIINYSAFKDASGDPEKQFLVMPIADGGDLGRSGRVERYKESVDHVFQIGRQLVSALMTAHDEGVIHRDLKPANVLFMGLGQEIWLSDFGISLIRDPAPDPHDCGRAFLAPELDNGAQLDVPPAVDVYSLGKVLYFLFSGGVILPADSIDDPKYSAILQQGTRRKALHALLRQMACPLESRLKTMPEVMTGLDTLRTPD
jgi:serine/threonine protein kinase